jgi:soluble epoxide hydrolase / lipid-phosphate phosphatase
MEFELAPRRTFTTTRHTTYSFIHIPPTDPRRHTLLFLHGFPSHLHDWERQISHFGDPGMGYGILAPDLLGYRQSSQPADAALYRLRPMADDVMELVDSALAPEHGSGGLIGIGHDFGATLLSRLAAYHPHRWRALVFLSVGPPRLGTPFDVASINSMTKEMLGFELLGYIPWLAHGEGAQTSLESHAEAMMSLVFCAERKTWDEWYRPLGRMKQFVEENRRVAIGSWYTPELRRKHLEAFGRPGGYGGAVRWYQMWMDNLSSPDEVGFESAEMEAPILFIGEKGSMGTAQQQQMLGAWAPKMTTVEIEGGHWIHLERPEETNEAIEEFLRNK